MLEAEEAAMHLKDETRSRAQEKKTGKMKKKVRKTDKKKSKMMKKEKKVETVKKE